MWEKNAVEARQEPRYFLEKGQVQADWHTPPLSLSLQHECEGHSLAVVYWPWVHQHEIEL